MPVINHVRRIRESRKISAAGLAKLAGVTRQTVYAIEDGTFVPNTSVSLRLARALQVKVEELFHLAEEPPLKPRVIEPQAPGSLVRICKVGGKLFAAAAGPIPAFLPNADGVLSPHGEVAALPGLDYEKRFAIAGCDPALSILEQCLAPSGIELVTIPCSSRRALELLRAGKVQAAGSHLLDDVSGVYNIPFVKELFPRGRVQVTTFAEWEQGIVVQRGNPKRIRSVPDLGNGEIAIVNRESGSGSRSLLDAQLKAAGVARKRVKGYSSIANTHLQAAYSVAVGAADCCIAPRAAAVCFALDFIPVAVQRFDICMTRAAAGSASGAAVLDSLNGAKVKGKLRDVAGHDSAHTGRVLMQ